MGRKVVSFGRENFCYHLLTARKQFPELLLIFLFIRDIWKNSSTNKSYLKKVLKLFKFNISLINFVERNKRLRTCH